MSIRYDSHMHSSFSEDSDTPMRDMVRQAKALGLSGVIFTEHVDLDYPKRYGTFTADIDQEEQMVRELREEFPSLSGEAGFRIGYGIECGMQRGLADRYSRIVSSHPFDLVIASQHLVGRDDPYFPESWKGHSPGEYIALYYEQMYANLSEMDDWDTLAHMDYIIRYIPDGPCAGNGDDSAGKAPDDRGKFQMACGLYDSMMENREIIDAILELVIREHKCLEVNTAGYKYGLGQPNPSPSILRRYLELGGRRITIGADAHAPEHIAFAFEEARQLLLSLGFRTYNVFEKRKSREVPL